MKIKEIYLKNFRNYQEQKIVLQPHVNVFYGNNAQGKTNVLEALYVCALGRSFRTRKEKELIHFQEDVSQIKVVYEKQGREQTIEITLESQNKKVIHCNGIPVSKNSELVGNINLVMFSPDDITMLKQGPAMRRRFLDILISQIKPNYLHELSLYHRVLEQRNAMLKTKQWDTIAVWEEQLATQAEKIVRYRKTYLTKLQEKLNEIHPRLTSQKETIQLEYETKFQSKEQFLQLLENRREVDMMRGFTGEGIHREDFSVWINGKSLTLYGSQGQHRTAMLAMKMAEMKLIEEEIGEMPVLLLDDVTSELDESRVNAIFEAIQEDQVLITCTDINTILKYECLTKHIKLYKINSGQVD